MDNMKLKMQCNRLLKLSFLMVIILFLYLKWTHTGPPQRLKVKVIEKNGNFLVMEAGENSTQFDMMDFHMNNVRQQYDLRVICIVYNRAQSVLRLLNSVNEAKYYNDKIKVEVWIDRSKDGNIDPTVLNATKHFTFRHGDYSVHPQPTHVGIYGQWLSTWKPVENSSEIAVILEDDLVVSPLFYKYLKMVHNKYDSYPSINGYALQGISIKHGGGAGYLEAPYNDPIFVYPVLGTWGFSPSTKNWLKFLKWFESVHSDKTFKPYVPDNLATSWYKEHEGSGAANKMWSMWHIYFAWKNNEVTMYSNIKEHHGLTANMYEAGLHYQGQLNEKKSSNPLLTTWKPEYENLPDKPVKLNLVGKRVDY